MKLPESFKERIMRIYGAPGVAWLASLDKVLASAAERFGLRNLELMEDLSYNVVAKAESDSYGPCVLKLSVERDALKREAKALEYYNGSAAVRLFNDLSDGILLLELLEPGRSLKQLFPQRDEEATQIAASVITLLHAKPGEPEGFPSLREWFKPFFEKQSPALSFVYDKAQGIARDLLSVKDVHYLCHGDLHHGNILESSRGWISIDPKGVIAPTWFEIGCFMSNPLTLLDYHAQPILERRFDQFSELLALDRQLLVCSSYVVAVLAACWSLEEGNEAECEYFLRCAQLMKC